MFKGNAVKSSTMNEGGRKVKREMDDGDMRGRDGELNGVPTTNSDNGRWWSSQPSLTEGDG